MLSVQPSINQIDTLKRLFGDRLQENVSLSRFTAARIGGPADMLLDTHSYDELAQTVKQLWRLEIPFVVLGGGSNVLASDMGVREVVILNRSQAARGILFKEDKPFPTVWAESGVNFSSLSRQAARRGLAGLEWAAGIPGTLGGAVVGNAGAFGCDVSGNLLMAEILHRQVGLRIDVPQHELWAVERLEYGYRSSILKGYLGGAVVLSARLQLERSTPLAVQEKIDEYVTHRRRTQPPGASMGSMFKNPPGDHAGRLIEAAGLKGTRCGGAEISSLHANFFVNLGRASAADVYSLIRLAQDTVAQKFEVELELEIELLGEWLPVNRSMTS